MTELERIRALTELISAAFPVYLFATEEEMHEPARLSPLRYVGRRQTMLATISGPLLLNELATFVTTIKDRIIRQTGNTGLIWWNSCMERWIWR